MKTITKEDYNITGVYEDTDNYFTIDNNGKMKTIQVIPKVLNIDGKITISKVPTISEELDVK